MIKAARQVGMCELFVLYIVIHVFIYFSALANKLLEVCDIKGTASY